MTGGVVEVDLGEAPLAVVFAEAALQSSTHLNLVRDGRIALHIKYLPMRGGFVLNDMRGDAWGAEAFLGCLRVPGGTGIRVALTLGEDGLSVDAPGSDPLILGDRFDLGGRLKADVPPTITVASVEAEGGASVPAAPLRVQTAEAAGIAIGMDAAIGSSSAFYLEGWVDDRRAPLTGVGMVDFSTGLRAQLPFGRIRRNDVDEHLRVSKPGEFGFWAVGLGGLAQMESGAMSLQFADGASVPITLGPRTRQGEAEFFEFLLAQYGRRQILGNIHARSFAEMGAGYGEVIGKLYRQIAATRRVSLRAEFGAPGTTPDLSLICVLYGFPDFLYLLVSQFARFGPLDGLEFIFVNNSPEMEEVLLRDAELASFVFGANIRLIGLNQNCGFSHANNVGVEAARARTVAIVNPDVFPRHAAALDHLRAMAATSLGPDIVGGKLYYADGSVMHEGMYFDQDRRLSVLCGTPVWTVEHFRKGFADTAPETVREVPALTGAMMILERATFQKLGGFSRSFVFGHYEDADLCLRVRDAGGRVLLDPALAYWHYEGMGSIKKPEHVGSNLYNRWYFSRLWGRRLAESRNV